MTVDTTYPAEIETGPLRGRELPAAPSSSRPPERTSRLATCLASTSGLRCGPTTIPVAHSSRSVTAATRARRWGDAALGAGAG
jgi:hypothetical protein